MLPASKHVQGRVFGRLYEDEENLFYVFQNRSKAAAVRTQERPV
jgi:hypothetical protein